MNGQIPQNDKTKPLIERFDELYAALIRKFDDLDLELETMNDRIDALEKGDKK